MKMGTTPSRFPYDAAARDALQLASLRCSAIWHYASWIPRCCEVVRIHLRKLDLAAIINPLERADKGDPNIN